MFPKISVIIPAYNRPNLLRRAIKSVLNQTFQNFELIIVDDGSTENIKSVVEEFRDKRIHYFWQKNFGGPAKPRNSGIKNSIGKYIAFLDDDDEWLNNKLEKQIELFKKSEVSNLGFVSSNCLVVYGENGCRVCSNIPKAKNIFQKLLVWPCVNSCSGIIVKKEVFDKIGFFDENLKMFDDWDICLRIAKEYNFDFVKEPLFKHYVSSGNINQMTEIEKKEKEVEYIFNKYRKYYKENPKIYGLKLMHEGINLVAAGRIKKGREYFIRAIKLNPFYFKSYLFYLFSLFGSNFFDSLTKLKTKLKSKK